MNINSVFCCFNPTPNQIEQRSQSDFGAQVANQHAVPGTSCIIGTTRITNRDHIPKTNRDSRQPDVVRVNIHGSSGLNVLMMDCKNITVGSTTIINNIAPQTANTKRPRETVPVHQSTKESKSVAVVTNPSVLVTKKFEFDKLILNYGMTNAKAVDSSYKKDGIYNARNIHLKDIINEPIPGLRHDNTNATAIKHGRSTQHITIEDGATLRDYQFAADKCIIILEGSGQLLGEPVKNTEIRHEYSTSKHDVSGNNA